MDPLVCFYAWLGAVQDGELSVAPDLAKTVVYVRPSRFEKEYGRTSTNFMTPTILGWWTAPMIAVELSTGEFMGKQLYGVSVAHKGGRCGSCAHSLEEAEGKIRRALRGDLSWASS